MKLAHLFGMVMIVVLLASPAMASNCPEDLSGDGTVGFADLTQLLAAWGPCSGCTEDLGGDGTVGFADLTRLLAAWGSCPVSCPAGIPEFYEQVSDIERAAGGTCVEYAGIDGPPACPQEDFLRFKAEIEYMIETYPFTGAVFDALSGGGQSYGVTPDIFLCYGLGQDPENLTIFDDLNSCYHATSDCQFNCDFVNPRFDWAVNVEDIIEDYRAIANSLGGDCELDGMIGGGPTGFHASVNGFGWRQWTVTVQDQCDYEGCLCDATLRMVSNPDVPGEYFLEDMINNNMCIDGTCCEDPRFDF